MELRTVDELMELLRTRRDARTPGDALPAHEHALRTAALLRRGHPSDKELQVAGLVHNLGQTLRPGDAAHVVRESSGRAAEAVRALLGERVAGIVRLHGAARRYLTAAVPEQWAPALGTQDSGPMPQPERAAFVREPFAEDALTLCQAEDAALTSGLDGGVLEDWWQVLELVAERRPVRTGRAQG